MISHNPKVTLLLGMVALLAANLFQFAKHWMHSEAWPDAILGFFYGVAIGLLLLSVWQRTHAHR